MKTLARLQILAFWRRWPLSLLAAATVIGVIGAGAYELYLVGLPDAAVLEALGNFTRYSIILPVIVAVLTFEFLSTPRLTGMEEAVDAHRDTADAHWIAMMVPPVLLVAAIFLTYVMLKFAVLLAAQLVEVLALHMLGEAILNVLAPCIVALLLGAWAARRLNRYAGYAVLALFAFLIGPYAEIVPMLAQAGIANGGTGLNLYPIYDLFRVLAPDPTWNMDALYGLPLETTRWALAGFWIAGLLVLLPVAGNRHARAGSITRIALAALAALCLLYTFLPNSVLRRDYRFFGGSSIVSEQIYYQIQAQEHPERERAADFVVDRYDMELSAGRELQASVAMEISGNADSGPYHFTLYHGYRVERVENEHGEALEFAQQGDYVTVNTAERPRTITFDYRGNGGIHLANHQGVFLPGYFPYYPVPGFVRVWDDVRLSPIADFSNVTPAQFSVAFDAGAPVASNLEFMNGRYQGRTVTPSFVGGLLTQNTMAGHRLIYYPASTADPAKLPDLLKRVDDLARSLESSGSPLADGATLIQMPELAQGQTVALQDTIFVMGIDESLAVDILIAATPMRVERENLKEAFARVMNDPDALESVGGERPTAREVAGLEQDRVAAASDLEVMRVYHNPAKDVVLRLFREKVREQGAREALRETYRYLSSDSDMSELEFLAAYSEPEAQ